MVIAYCNKSENRIIFSFSGRMDTVTSRQAGETVGDKIAEFTGNCDRNAKHGIKVIFDLGEVNFIASAFIRICMNMYKLSESGKFSIIKCDPLIKKTFKIAGLDELLKVS